MTLRWWISMNKTRSKWMVFQIMLYCQTRWESICDPGNWNEQTQQQVETEGRINRITVTEMLMTRRSASLIWRINQRLMTLAEMLSLSLWSQSFAKGHNTVLNDQNRQLRVKLTSSWVQKKNRSESLFGLWVRLQAHSVTHCSIMCVSKRYSNI